MLSLDNPYPNYSTIAIPLIPPKPETGILLSSPEISETSILTAARLKPRALPFKELFLVRRDYPNTCNILPPI